MEKRNSKKIRMALAAWVLGALTMPAFGGAYATTYVGSDTITVDESTKEIKVKNMTQNDSENSLSLGVNSLAEGEGAVAVGFEAKAQAKHAVVFGNGSQATAENATAFGVNSYAQAEEATAVGFYNYATGIHSAAIGVRNNAKGKDESYNVAVGVANDATGDLQAVAVGYGNKALKSTATAVGKTNTAGAANSAAIGVSNTAGTEGATYYSAAAVGISNKATNERASAFGYENKASGVWSSAIGYNNTASAEKASALGYFNTASEQKSSAVGFYNKATVANASAFGDFNTASASGTVAFGYYNKAKAQNSSAVGVNNTAAGVASSAVGYTNKVYGENSAAFGYTNTVGVDGATSGAGTYVFGANNTVTADNALVLGTGISTVAANSVVIGAGSTSEEENTVSVGAAKTDTAAEVTRKIVHVADGTVSSDAATYGQLVNAQAKTTGEGESQTTTYTPYKADDNGIVTVQTNDGDTAFQIQLEKGESYVGSDTISITQENDQNVIRVKNMAQSTSATDVQTNGTTKAKGTNAVAFGVGAQATADETQAFGTGAEAIDKNAIALGSGAVAFGEYSTAVGNSAKAYARASIAIGMNATVGVASGKNDDGSSMGNQQGDSQYGIAIGDGAHAAQNFGLAVGAGSYVSGSLSSAFGYQSYATGYGAVAIGAYSVASVARAKETLTDGSTAQVSTVSFGHQNGDAYKSYNEGKHTHTYDKNYTDVALSRLVNVAEGKANTDAVNFSQIKTIARSEETGDLANGTYIQSSLSTDTDDSKVLNAEGTVGKNLAALDKKAVATAGEAGDAANVNVVNLSQESRGDDKGQKNQIVANDGTVLATFTRMKNLVADDYGFVAGADLYNASMKTGQTVSLSTEARGDGDTSLQNTIVNNKNEVIATFTPMGSVSSDDTGFVSGTNLYTEVRPNGTKKDAQGVGDFNYIDKGNTTAVNLAALDKAIQESASVIIGDDGETDPQHWLDVKWNTANDGKRGKNSAAYGYLANAASENSVALGYQAKASAAGAVAIGSDSVADVANTVSVGSVGHERKIVNVAVGSANTDAANYGQLVNAQAIKGADGSVSYTPYEAGEDGIITVKTNDNGTAFQIKLSGEGAIAEEETRLINGATAYAELRPVTSKNYISEEKTTAANLSELDKAIGKTAAGGYIFAQDGDSVTVATNLKALDDKSVKKNHPTIELASGTEGELKSNDDTTLAKIKIKDGEVNASDTGYTTGATVYSALAAAKTEQEKLIKLNGNQIVIGDGVTADTVSVGTPNAERRIVNVGYGQDNHDAATAGQLIALATNATSTDKTKNQTATLAFKDTALGSLSIEVPGQGTVASDDVRLVSGATLYGETRNAIATTNQTLNYISDRDAASNLLALDKAIGKTAAGGYIFAQDGDSVTVATNLKALDDKSVKKNHPTIELASGTEGELKSNDNTTLAKIKIKDGEVNATDTGYTTGATVYNALAAAKTEQEKLIKLNGNQIVIGDGVTSDTVSVGTPNAERRIVNVGYGEDNHDAATAGQLIASATNATSTDKTKAQTATLAFKDTALGSLSIEVPGQGTVALDDVRLVSGATLYGETRNAIATTNQTLNYISDRDAASNLLALDKAIGKTVAGGYISAQDGDTVTVATNLKALDDKSVKKDHPTIELASGTEGELKSNDNTTLAKIKIKDGEVNASDTGYTTGATVYNALAAAKTEQEKLIKLNGNQIVIGDGVTAETVSIGNRTITGVKAGTESTDAVNKGQLDTAIAGTKYTAGNEYVTVDNDARTVSVNVTGAIVSGNGGLVTGGTVYNSIVANDIYKLNSDKKTITVKNGADQTAFTLDLSGLPGGGGASYTAGDHIKISGDEISVVTNGTVTSGNTGLVTGGTVYDAIQKQIGQIAPYTGDNETISVGSDKIISAKTGEIGAGVKTLVTGETAYNALVANDTYKLNDDKKTITVKNGKGDTAFTLNLDGLTGGSGVTYEAGDHVSISSDNVISVATDGKIESGNTGIVTGGAIYDKMGETSKLSEAGLGDNLTDSVLAVNSKIDGFSNDIGKVGAGAAALAALHPEDYNPSDKWSFAVGYGHYKGANAGALGAFFKPNADTTLSVGGTIGNGDTMMNAGVSFKLGSRGKMLGAYSSNKELIQEVNSLRANNAAQAERIANLEADNRKMKADNERMQRQIAMILSQMQISGSVRRSATK